MDLGYKRPTRELIAADKQHVWHPFCHTGHWCAPGHEPIVLAKGEGAWLWDTEGNRYLDGNSSIWTAIHGHAHPVIQKAIQDQFDHFGHVSFLGFTHPPAIRLAEKLLETVGTESLTRVFYSDSGSAAIEVALRLCLEYRQRTAQPERSTVVSFSGSYHGDTLGAASVGGSQVFHSEVAGLGYRRHRVRSMDELHALSPETIATLNAVIIEPGIQGPAGMRIWPRGLLRELRAWCDHHGLFLICDEVMTGFGRTGAMFACQLEGVAPDFLALGKALTAGYSPLAATITTEAVFRVFQDEPFLYGHTYTAHAPGCAAALASLQLFEEQQTLQRLQPLIRKFEACLEAIADHPRVAETRSLGFVGAVEVVNPEERLASGYFETYGNRVCLHARPHGLLTRAIGNTIVLMFPYCITEAEIESAFAALHAALEVP